MEKRIKEFLSKPFPVKDLPQWLLMVVLYPKEELDLVVKHWYKSFAKYYDELQRSNYMNLDEFLLKHQDRAHQQIDDLDFLYSFNDYQLYHAQGVEMENAVDGPIAFFE